MGNQKARSFIVILSLTFGLYSSLVAQMQRPMTVEDLFTIEQLGDIAVSPDREWLAVVVKRARTKAEIYKKDFLSENDHADIWLVSRTTGDKRNLTNGLVDGSGYWNPVWSPDGKRIAILSTKGGDNARLYIWEKESREIKRLTDRGVDLETNFNPTGSWPFRPFIWLNNTTLLCPVLPKGEQPVTFKIEIQTPGIAAREWPKAERGLEPTVSVLESGREIPESERPKNDLLLIDIFTGSSEVLAEGVFKNILLSPNGKFAALLADTGNALPNPKRLLRFENLKHSKLGITKLEKGHSVHWISEVIEPKIAFSEVNHRWSPDGSKFAVIGKVSKADEKAETLYLVDAPSATTKKMAAENMLISALFWANKNEILVYASKPADPSPGAPPTRLDWWKIDITKLLPKASPITSKMKETPSQLLRIVEPNILLGLGAGDLWSINLKDGSFKNMTETFGPEIETVLWPKEKDLFQNDYSEIIVRGKEKEKETLYRIDLSGQAAKPEPFPLPAKEAEFADFLPEKNLSIFTGTLSDGTFVWISADKPGQFIKRISLNEHLSTIAEAKRVLIEYRGVEGDNLKGLVLLPIGYEEGKKYPLVVFVYAGHVVKDTKETLTDKNHPIYLNLQLMAAHGYAVLVPSMPLRPEGEASDPYIDLPKGVITAVDKVIDMGIADPNKLGVWGQSYGGYSTYTLVTYTNRFKAAIALAGLSDLISLYGTFDARYRYTDFPHEQPFAAALSETGQVRMGNSIWADLWRYLRNSPLFFLDRVETPLMIIQGDVDYVALQQGEEFFSGLYRLGKKAKFVRYWGDSHTLESPANIRDMWNRVFEWFDEHFKEEQKKEIK